MSNTPRHWLSSFQTTEWRKGFSESTLYFCSLVAVNSQTPVHNDFRIRWEFLLSQMGIGKRSLNRAKSLRTEDLVLIANRTASSPGLPRSLPGSKQKQPLYLFLRKDSEQLCIFPELFDLYAVVYFHGFSSWLYIRITQGALNSTDVGPSAKSTESNMIPKVQLPELKTIVLLPRMTRSTDK